MQYLRPKLVNGSENRRSFIFDKKYDELRWFRLTRVTALLFHEPVDASLNSATHFGDQRYACSQRNLQSGGVIGEDCSPSPGRFNGVIVGSVGARQLYERHRARNHHILLRAPKESRAILIRLLLNNGHDLDKTLENIEPDNRIKDIGFHLCCR